MQADLEIAIAIRDVLTATRRDLRRVGILVRHGVVRLCGAVPSPHLRHLALGAAWRVHGVVDVIDEIRVRGE